MSETTIVAIIVALSTLSVTLVDKIISGIIEAKKNKGSRYLENITQSRIQWINLMREEVADYIASAFRLKKHITEDDTFRGIKHDDDIKLLNSEKFEFTKKKVILVLRLNPKDDEHLITLIKRMYEVVLDSQIDIDVLECNIEHIEKGMNKTLKCEWEKIKKEYEGNGKTKLKIAKRG